MENINDKISIIKVILNMETKSSKPQNKPPKNVVDPSKSLSLQQRRLERAKRENITLLSNNLTTKTITVDYYE